MLNLSKAFHILFLSELCQCTFNWQVCIMPLLEENKRQQRNITWPITNFGLYRWPYRFLCRLWVPFLFWARPRKCIQGNRACVYLQLLQFLQGVSCRLSYVNTSLFAFTYTNRIICNLRNDTWGPLTVHILAMTCMYFVVICRGTQLVMRVIGYCVTCVVSSVLFVPLLYPLKITSSFEV